MGVNRPQSLATIQAAIDAGIDAFDTAYSYGYDGESDRMLGEVLRRSNNAGRSFFVIGKAGQRWTQRRVRVVDASASALIADAKASLRRIGIERFDLLMLHGIDPNVPIEISAGAMRQLRDRGLAASVGVCNVDEHELRAFANVVECAAIQCPLNLLQPDSLDPLIRVAASLGANAHVYWTLMKGLLAGKITRDQILDPADSRSRYEIFQGDARRRAHDIVDRLAIVAKDHDMTVSQLAIGWALAQDGVTAALVGAKRPDQIVETANSQPLHRSLLAVVDGVLQDIQGG